MIRSLNKVYLLTAVCCIVFLMSFTKASAQSLDSMKKQFYDGQYEQVDAYFTQKYKAYKQSATYNFFYGACSAHLGREAEAIPCLVMAAKHHIIPAYEQLAALYTRQYKFALAKETYEDLLSYQNRYRKPTDQTEAALKALDPLFSAFKGIENITIVDSIVVDKERFLSEYFIDSSLGHLTQESADQTLFESQMGGIQLYGGRKLITRDDKESQLASTDTTTVLNSSMDSIPYNIYMRRHLKGSWGAPQKLGSPINVEGCSSNYPFLMGDGQTLYFAQTGKESLGGYDIFVTRKLTNDDAYLTPQNLGMPFNSPANDYMLVIDQIRQLGWWASDRYQPKGKVCIYVFIPNETKVTFDYLTVNADTLIAHASMRPIALSQLDKGQVTAGKERLSQLKNKILLSREKANWDFSLVINDNNTYHKLRDFHSAKAAKLYVTYQQSNKDYTILDKRLTLMREKYADGNQKTKEELTPIILQLEQQVAQLREDIKLQKLAVIKEENK
ncbi:MAG: hypothetical protein WCR36_03790 [Bacteroidaceae bacterium]